MKNRTFPFRRRGLGRRRFLKTAGGVVAASLLPTGCVGSLTQEEMVEDNWVEGPERLPETDWLHGASVGGVELWLGITPFELEGILDGVAEQGITVAELDSDLSHYLSDDDFQRQVELLDAAARGCHRRGIHAVAYFPSLEVLTNGADDASTRTMARDRPEWVQTDLLNQPSVFIGGDGRVFWVDPGTESAWMCPLTPYADYFLDRVRKLADTSLDGIWPDVPLLSDIAAVWPCTDPACRARFHADTGYHIPTYEKDVGFRDHDGKLMEKGWPDFDDPAFRRWVEWRHGIVAEFEQKIVDAVNSVRDDSTVIVETVTMDYSGATIQGLDGAWAAPGALRRVWEVDAVSDETGMRDADARDWLSMAIMMKHGRGCMGEAPSWTFCYGKQEDDAERVMGFAVATQNGPFEARIPDMLTSVGKAYRRRVSDYVKPLKGFYRGSSVARVGLLYAPSARDILDQTVGVGLYTGFNSDDELWWSGAEVDAAHTLPYLGDYRGMCGALMALHEVFDVITPPHVSAAALAQYEVLVLPSPAAVSDGFIAAIEAWVSAGGTLVLTGSTPGLYDEQGVQRATPELAARLGVTMSEGWTETPFGEGRTIATTVRAGQDWYAGYPAPTGDLASKLSDVLSAYRQAPLAVEAPSTVFLDARRTDDDVLWVALGNLTGLGTGTGQRFDPQTADVTLMVTTPSVTIYEPGQSARKLEVVQGRVRVTLASSMVIELA